MDHPWHSANSYKSFQFFLSHLMTLPMTQKYVDKLLGRKTSVPLCICISCSKHLRYFLCLSCLPCKGLPISSLKSVNFVPWFLQLHALHYPDEENFFCTSWKKTTWRWFPRAFNLIDNFCPIKQLTLTCDGISSWWIEWTGWICW